MVMGLGGVGALKRRLTALVEHSFLHIYRVHLRVKENNED